MQYLYTTIQGKVHPYSPVITHLPQLYYLPTCACTIASHSTCACMYAHVPHVHMYLTVGTEGKVIRRRMRPHSRQLQSARRKGRRRRRRGRRERERKIQHKL